MSTTRSRTNPSEGVSALQPRTSGIEPSALWTLFTLTLRQFLHGKRIYVLGTLALLPAGLAILVRTLDQVAKLKEIEFVFLFNLIPHVLLPLTALVYGTGMILDEQEEQTMTYLLIRSLPKWALYLMKLLATMCMVAGLSIVFVVITFLATYLGSSQFLEVFPLKMLETIVIMTLAIGTYTAIFGCMSLLVERSMIVGIVYIVAVEGIMANLDFALRKLTVVYYLRVLAMNWLDLDNQMTREWSLSDTPDPIFCVLTMLGVIAITTVVATRIFSVREFNVKTPESN